LLTELLHPIIDRDYVRRLKAHLAPRFPTWQGRIERLPGFGFASLFVLQWRSKYRYEVFGSNLRFQHLLGNR
jgi:hypothetical protein